MANLYITATGKSIWGELKNTSNKLIDYIDNTSNDLAMNINNTSNYIKITSNLLHQEIQYTSNENYKYSSNETHKYYHNDYGPFDGYPYVLGSMPPAMQPIPTNVGAIEAYSLTTQFRRANLKSVYFDELQDKSIKGHIHLIEEILQNNEIRTNLNEIQSLAWQAVSMNNKIQSSANSTAITGMQTEITAISKVLGITTAGTAFNTLYSIGDFIGNAITFFSTNNDGDLTEIKTFDEYLWLVFHREPENGALLESITVNQERNATIINPNSNISRATGTTMNYQYIYGNVATPNNSINILTGDNTKIKESLLLFDNAFSVSCKVVFKSLNDVVFLALKDDNYSYILLSYLSGLLNMSLNDKNGSINVYQSVNYTFNINQIYHIVFTHNKNSNLKIYVDKVEIKSYTYQNVPARNYQDITSSSMKFSILPNAKDIKIEDYRIYTKQLTLEEITSLYNVYEKVQTIEDTLQANIDIVAEDLLNTSNKHEINFKNTSNWIYNNSNELAININNTSNWIINNNYRIDTNILNTSNWITNNHNRIDTNIFNTSNWIKDFQEDINIKTDGLWLNDGENVYNLNKHIGIGTIPTTEAYKLQVVGDTALNGSLSISGDTTTKTLFVPREIKEVFDMNSWIFNNNVSSYYVGKSTEMRDLVSQNIDGNFPLQSITYVEEYYKNFVKKDGQNTYSLFCYGQGSTFNKYTIGGSFIFAKPDIGVAYEISLFDTYLGGGTINQKVYSLKAYLSNTLGVKLRFYTDGVIYESEYYSQSFLPFDTPVHIIFMMECRGTIASNYGFARIYINGLFGTQFDNFNAPELEVGGFREIWIGNDNPNPVWYYNDIVVFANRYEPINTRDAFIQSIYNASKQYYSVPNTILLNKTYIQDLDINADKLFFNGEQYFTNNKNNYKTTPEVGKISVGDDNTRRNLFIDTTKINGTNNLINETNNSGYLYYQDGNTSTTAQVKSISYSEITNKPTNLQADWNTTIINKPTNFQADCNTTIINKPTNFQADWNTSIINKPNIETISGNITTSSNLQTSNYVLNTSNIISNRISGLNNVSLATIGNITTSSNLNTSNYVLNTSNIISTRINNLPLTKWIDNANYLSYSNVNVYNDKIIIGNGTTLTKYPKQPFTNNNNVKQLTSLNQNLYPDYLAFNHNLTDTVGQHSGVNYTNGTANNNATFSFSGYNGDYIMVNIGEKFILNKVNFYNRGSSEAIGRVPGVFRIYGTNDINLFNNPTFISGWTLILDNTVRLTGYTYGQAKEVLISGNTNAFSIYILVVNQLSGTTANDTVLNFVEWELYGYAGKVLADEIDIQNTSNYVLNTSNVISNIISGLNNISLATIGNIATSSNLNTSNYVLNTSNAISNIISGLNNISLATIGNIATSSNLNTSNYVLNTQNNLTTLINTKQNTLTAGTNISIVGNTVNSTAISSQWTTSTSNIIYSAGRVIVGNNDLTIRNGNTNAGSTKDNILFGFNNTDTYRHSIKSRHEAGAIHTGNAIDFYLWKNGQLSTDIGNIHMASITPVGVGINGKTVPSFALDVIGDVNCSGNFKINGVNLSTGGGSVAWADITSKPTTFTPSTHTHLWADITDKPITFAPSTHTHTTSDITGLDTALAGKQATITGGATTITSTNLTANRVLLSDANGKVSVASTTTTQLSYLDATSSLQTQINNKISSQWTTTGSDIFYDTGIIKTNKSFSAIGTNSAFTLGAGTDFGKASTNGAYSSSAVVDDAVLRTVTGSSLILQSGSGTSHIHIRSSGNVGIGKTDASKKFQVINSTQGSISVVGTGDVRYHCYNNGGIQEWAWGQKSNTSHNWILSTLNSGNEVDILTVATNGDMGIGKTPAYKLDVSGDVNYSGTLRKNGVDVLANVVSSGTKIKVESIWTSSFQTFTIPAFGSDRYTKNVFETSGTFVDGFYSFCVTAFNSPTIYSCGNFYKTGNNILNVSQRINNGVTCNSYNGASPYFGQFQITNDLGGNYYYTVNSTCICPTTV